MLLTSDGAPVHIQPVHLIHLCPLPPVRGALVEASPRTAVLKMPQLPKAGLVEACRWGCRKH